MLGLHPTIEIVGFRPKTVVIAMKRFFSLLLAVIVVGTGYAPAAMNPAQGKLMARRAAQVDCFKQTGGSPFTILSEVFDGHTYHIEAEAK